MSNLRFSAELLSDVIFRAGEPATGSDFAAQSLIYLNRAYRTIWMGGAEFDPRIDESWWWLRKDPPGHLILDPAITTGTVAVTADSATATLSAAPSVSMAGWFFRVDTHPDIFRVSTHSAGFTTLTLDGLYTGTTAAAATYRLFKLEYTLASDVLRLLAPIRVHTSGRARIDGIDPKRMDDSWPLTDVSADTPWAFAPVGESKIRFSNYPSAKLRVEYDYLQRPADLTNSVSEEPLIPLQFRHLLSDIALYYIFFDKNDSRSDAIALQAKAGLAAMALENRHRMAVFSSTYGKLMQRPLNAPARPLRTESGAIISWS